VKTYIYTSYIYDIYVIYMVQATIHFTENANHILNIVKAKHKFKDKSEAVNFIVTKYGEELLEPELKPEFIAHMQQVMREKPIFVGSIENFDKVIDNFEEDE
jgi:hypothetical protein